MLSWDLRGKHDTPDGVLVSLKIPSAQKAPQGSETETSKLLEGMKDNSFFSIDRGN